ILDGHRGIVRAAAFSPDGRLLATGGSDKRILVYNVPPPGSKPAELREHKVLEGHQGVIACLAFSLDSRHLASGSEKTTRTGPAEVKLWDAGSGQAIASWNDHTGDVAVVAFHP